MRHALIAAAALILANSAAAQPTDTRQVYRCPGAVYQAKPCAHGRQLEIDREQNIMDRERRRPSGKYDGDGPSVLMLPRKRAFFETEPTTTVRRSSRTVYTYRAPPPPAPPPAPNRRAP